MLQATFVQIYMTTQNIRINLLPFYHQINEWNNVCRHNQVLNRQDANGIALLA
jgi:hypothetical protein